MCFAANFYAYIGLWQRATDAPRPSSSRYINVADADVSQLALASHHEAYAIADWALWLSYPVQRRPALLFVDPQDPLLQLVYAFGYRLDAPKADVLAQWLCANISSLTTVDTIDGSHAYLGLACAVAD